MSWFDIFNAQGKDLDAVEIAIRTALIFLITLFLIRIGKKRFLGKNTAFDTVLAVIAGSVISRAINGSAPFIQTIVATFVLVAMHWIISAIVARSNSFANLVEGTAEELVKDGTVNRQMLIKHHLRELDILEAARLKGNTSKINNIKEAHLEANGEISVVK